MGENITVTSKYEEGSTFTLHPQKQRHRMSGNNEEVRINKYIASSGLCSRREADRLIEEGKVTINGVTAEPGAKVMSSDTVSVMGKTVIPEESMLYIALNKPLGITCTTDTRDPSNIR